MDYGRESLSEKEQGKVSALFDTKVTQEELGKWNTPMDMSRMGDLSAEVAEEQRDIILDKLASEDQLESYISNEAILDSSPWLFNREIPQKAELDDELDAAQEYLHTKGYIKSLKEVKWESPVKAKEVDTSGGGFEIKAYSQSQRTKRGKKFKEKAVRQAAMIKETNLFAEGRQAAFVSVLNETLPEGAMKYGTHALDESMLDLSHLKGVHDKIDGNLVKDIAFYAEWKKHTELSKDKSDAKSFFRKLPKRNQKNTLSRVRNLIDPAEYKEEYVNMLLDLEKLDLDVFNYSDDKEFTRNFSAKYAAIRAFSHCGKMLLEMEKDERIAPIADKLRAKKDVLEMIMADYEQRMRLIRSPYYALLAAKDVDSMTNQEILTRILDTDDYVVRDYLSAMYDRRNGSGTVAHYGNGGKIKTVSYAKGKTASKIEKELLSGRLKDKKRSKKNKNDENEEGVVVIETSKEEKKNDYEEAKSILNNIYESYEPYLSQIKKNNKKLKESEAIAAVMDIKEHEKGGGLEADIELYKNNFQRSVKYSDCTKYLAGVSEEDKYAIQELISNIRFPHELAKGLADDGVNAGMRELDGKLDLYHSYLVELNRYGIRLAIAQNSFNNFSGFDPAGNEYFTKNDIKKIKTLADAAGIYKDKLLNDKRYKDLCKIIVKSTKEIADYIQDRRNRNQADETESLDTVVENASYIGIQRFARSYYKDMDGAYLGLSAGKAQELPEYYPEDIAAGSYEVFFGKKMDSKTASALKAAYTKKRIEITDLKSKAEECNKRICRENAKYLKIQGVSSIRDEYECVRLLDERKRAKFLTAVVTCQDSTAESEVKKEAEKTVRLGLEEVFDHIIKLDLKDFEYSDNKELIDNYDFFKTNADVIAAIDKLIERYENVGGALSDAKYERLKFVAGCLTTFSSVFRYQVALELHPEMAMLDPEKLRAIPRNKLEKIYAEMNKAKDKADFDCEKIETEQDKLRRERASIFTSTQAADKKRVKEIDRQLKTNEVRQNALRMDAENALRRQNLAMALIENKNFDAINKTSKDGYLNLVAGMHISKVQKRVIEIRKKEEAEDWEEMKAGYLEESEKFKKYYWEDVPDHLAGTAKLYYMGKKHRLISDLPRMYYPKRDRIDSPDHPVSLKSYSYGSLYHIPDRIWDEDSLVEQMVKNLKERFPIAIQGLIMQFKSTEVDVSKLVALSDEPKLKLKDTFKQFDKITFNRNHRNVGVVLAKYEELFRAAIELDDVFQDDKNTAISQIIMSMSLTDSEKAVYTKVLKEDRSAEIKEAVLKKLDPADQELYGKIIEFARKLMPMIEDLKKSVFETEGPARVTEKESLAIRSAAKTYVNTLQYGEKDRTKITCKKWTMPSPGPGYSAYKEAGDDVQPLLDNYYDVLEYVGN